MSLTKLSTRFADSTPKIESMITMYGSNLQVDLQQRGVEFSQLFKRFDHMRAALLEPMPPMERELNDNEVNSMAVLDQYDARSCFVDQSICYKNGDTSPMRCHVNDASRPIEIRSVNRVATFSAVSIGSGQSERNGNF